MDCLTGVGTTSFPFKVEQRDGEPPVYVHKSYTLIHLFSKADGKRNESQTMWASVDTDITPKIIDPLDKLSSKPILHFVRIHKVSSLCNL